jgi:hypothetical protein
MAGFGGSYAGARPRPAPFSSMNSQGSLNGFVSSTGRTDLHRAGGLIHSIVATIVGADFR